ncbi:MAG: S-methyl-5'-thioinosine phosphorylase [Gammaproteobacteria bacterium]|nr:S-methyl-5'-thioinosine phosphorylase [Gammaproteobacteria bacterium]
MADLAIIGGTGLTSLKGLEIIRKEVVHTPYGEPSGPLVHGLLAGKEVIFLPRHGAAHTIPPHRINYRANIWALKLMEVKRVVAVAAVGGIGAEAHPSAIVIPDQIIDYTWSRTSTFFDENLTQVTHVDFTYPYCAKLRKMLVDSGREINIDLSDRGVYGATQGPRLETAAEINRLAHDGCTLVGMTGMPEAALARELDLSYACCAVVANWAAGRGDGSEITMAEIERHLKSGMEKVRHLLEHLVPKL